MIKKPMLASRVTHFDALRFPLLGSPKYDGIRALTLNGVLVSRNLKPIPNDYIRKLAEGLPDNLDGELILDDGTISGARFNETSSAVMKKEGTPNVKYNVFDYVAGSIHKRANARQDDLLALDLSKWKDFVIVVKQVEITDLDELYDYEELCIEAGYEGIMLRDPNLPYKEGRSSEPEGALLKVKRFLDSEAKIIAFEERMHNANEAETDLLGYTKRSQAKAGLVPDGTLGKLYVMDIKTKVEFEIGTGFDDAQRLEIWKHQSSYIGRIVKYKYQMCGMLNKPRFPVFLGFRDKGDM